MQPNNNKIFIMMGLFAVFIVSMVISQYYNAQHKSELLKKRKAEYGSLHFTGKVISYKSYRYMNKNFYKICVKLDSANVKPLNIYNDDDAIRISNGTATFSAGYLNHILGPADSVAANIDNDGKIFLIHQGGVSEKRDFKFEPMGLTKDDLGR